MKFHRYIVIVGSSTGGIGVLEHIITDLPRIQISIIIIQHILESHAEKISQIFNKLTEMTVCVPENNEKIQNGYIYVAPTSVHLLLKNNDFFTYDYSDPVNRFRPSIDVTMMSCKTDDSVHFMGIILTGMAADGSKGIEYLKSIGAVTVAQDPKTAVIASMPLAAIKTGSVDTIASPDDIRNTIINFNKET